MLVPRDAEPRWLGPLGPGHPGEMSRAPSGENGWTRVAVERLQKIIAQAGVASRRRAETLITAGRVRVDGVVVTELGSSFDPRRVKVEVDGRVLSREQFCYGVLHKPRGMLTTLGDPEGRPTIAELLSKLPYRVVPIGRLDFNTSGVLLFSNDGDFVQGLLHARSGAEKVYAVTVEGKVDERSLARWSESIEIEGKRTKPAKARILRTEGNKTWLEVTLIEGKNRQVRRLGDHAGTPVLRLARLSYAGITVEDVRPGHFRLLSVDELKTLKAAFGVPTKLRGIVEQVPDAKATRNRPQRLSSGVSSPRPKTARPRREQDEFGGGARPARARSSGHSPGGRTPGARTASAKSFGAKSAATKSAGARPASAGSARASGRPAGGRSSPGKSGAPRRSTSGGKR